jgi:hypothetical protein
MKNFTLIVLLLLCQQLAAQGHVFVQSLDDDLNLSVMENENIKIQSAAPEPGADELPSPDELKNLFKMAGLEKETSVMDLMKQDIFYRQVKEMDLKSVYKRYPEISQKKIAGLKIIIGKSSK